MPHDSGKHPFANRRSAVCWQEEFDEALSALSEESGCQQIKTTFGLKTYQLVIQNRRGLPLRLYLGPMRDIEKYHPHAASAG